jgi:type I restriction enzyme, S subunit
MMRYGLKDTQIAQIQAVFVRYPAIDQVVLYGSRAMGTHKPHSDIDLTLYGDNLDTAVLNRISNELDDLLLPYTFDLSLFHHLENQEFIKHIERVGVVFWEREWEDIRLEEIVTIVNGYAFKSEDFKETGIPVIKIKNVKPNKINFDNLSYVDAALAETKSNFRIKKGDILLTMSGNRSDGSPDSWVGKSAIFNVDGNFMLNQRVAILRPKNDLWDKNFLAYYLSSWESQQYFINKANSSGGQANIAPQDIKDYSITLPPLTQQRAIASILTSLDDKIDLLHRQNATLEQMAEVLFRQWFVEEAKEDWEVVRLGDVCEVSGGTTPSTSIKSYWDGDIAWTTPRDLSNKNSIFLFDTERKITTEGLSKIGSGLHPVGTLLMSSRAPIGYLTILGIPVAINQGYIAIRGKGNISNTFLYLWCKENMDAIQNAGNGSTFQEISKTSFKQLSFQKPAEELLVEFESIADAQFSKIKSNQTQIRTLTEQRDTLLPKLMSGEVRVRM